MVEHVLALAREQPQIRREVVPLVAVLVVDTLGLVETSAKNSFRYETVLEAVPPKVRILMIGGVLVAIRTIVNRPTDISIQAKSDK